ncbi:MAG: UDPGP type 1 family protein [Phycisphaeraceae bacterium]
MLLTERLTAAQQTLQPIGQDHALRFYNQLDDAQKHTLLSQIESTDWPQVVRLIQTHVKHKPPLALPQKLQPAPWYPYRPTAELEAKYRRARQRGEELIRQGKVAAFTVAGGQATRLGYDAPKGTFPATPITRTPLFACLAQYIRKVQQKYNVVVPWYVMTSPDNDAPTRAFFAQHDYFGLDRLNVMLFTQATMPALDIRTGKVLLAAPGRLCLSPDGHGGSLKALYASGAIADMKRRGIEQISYTQVDNPHVRMVDPLFVGLHDLDAAQMSSKMLPKAYPRERLGNFCLVNGRVAVIEYSDLPDELADQRTADGELRFRAGSIAIHVIRVDFVEALNQRSGSQASSPKPQAFFALPYHRAGKTVPYVDTKTGRHVEPSTANAVKLETFVFDALPMCEKSIVYETDRIEEFAPIKNAEGVDSPETSRQLQIERAARWLESRGVTVPRNSDGRPEAVIEIQPLTAIEPADLDTTDLPGSIERGAKLLI